MGDLGCFSSTLTGESDSLIVPKLLIPKAVSDVCDAEGDVSAPILGAVSSGVGTGGRALRFGGIGGAVEGTGGVCVRVEGRDEISITHGNEAENGLMRGNASEILLESLHSTGDLIAIMLPGEAGQLSRKTGDEGADEARLIVLFGGKTVMPHLLVGRTGTGVSSGGVTGEFGSDGGEGSGTAASTDP